MASHEINAKAKNRIMGAMSNAIFSEEEEMDDNRHSMTLEQRIEKQQLIDEMRKQATRVVKFLGYCGFPGICVNGEPINR